MKVLAAVALGIIILVVGVVVVIRRILKNVVL